jgi:hypothetical protein
MSTNAQKGSAEPYILSCIERVGYIEFYGAFLDARGRIEGEKNESLIPLKLVGNG